MDRLWVCLGCRWNVRWGVLHGILGIDGMMGRLLVLVPSSNIVCSRWPTLAMGVLVRLL